MRRTRIVTDSTADIPSDLASELDIAIVPVRLPVDPLGCYDGSESLPESFYGEPARHSELSRGSEWNPVSDPPLKRFAETYQRLLSKERSGAVVSIHGAERVCGTLNIAWSASQMLTEPARVALIDTGQISMGIGWLAVEAARAARTGACSSEVVQAVTELLPRVRAAAIIDDPKVLRGGLQSTLLSRAFGRAPKSKALANLQAGEVLIWEKTRTQVGALQRLVDHVREWAPLVEVAVLHTGAKELAQYCAEALQDLIPARRMQVLPAGPGLIALVGLNALGVAAVVGAEG
jgi:DegV family protein with EDD domain